jgi:hypothetical protein
MARPALTGKLFVLSLVYKATVCALMLAVVEAHWVRIYLNYDVYPGYWIVGPLLAPGIGVSLILRRQVLNDTPKRWSAPLFGVESLLTLWVGWAFFFEPMHDIALSYFGHHGRFGAANLDNTPSPYLLNDATLPLILFLPPLLAGIAYFVANKRRTRQPL